MNMLLPIQSHSWYRRGKTRNKCQEGCLECDVTTKECLKCDQDNLFYLKNDKCKKKDKSCKAIDSEGNCLECTSPFYPVVNSTSLDNCRKKGNQFISQCVAYSSLGVCSDCAYDCYISDGICVKSDIIISNCTNYDIDNKGIIICKECQQGYYQSNSQQQCLVKPSTSDSCSAYQSLYCNKCNEGYYLAEQQFTPIVDNGFFGLVYNDNCTIIPEEQLDTNCEEYDSTGNCYLCKNDYYINIENNNKCDLIENGGDDLDYFLPNCLEQSTFDDCYQCTIDDYRIMINNEKRECIDNVIQTTDGCEEYDLINPDNNIERDSNCLKCTDYSTHYWNNFECIIRDTVDDQCTKYNYTSIHCKECSIGYRLDINNNKCIQYQQQCLQYNSDYQCQQCNFNECLIDQQCKDIPDNFDNIDSNDCQKCYQLLDKSQYLIDEDNSINQQCVIVDGVQQDSSVNCQTEINICLEKTIRKRDEVLDFGKINIVQSNLCTQRLFPNCQSYLEDDDVQQKYQYCDVCDEGYEKIIYNPKTQDECEEIQNLSTNIEIFQDIFNINCSEDDFQRDLEISVCQQQQKIFDDHCTEQTEDNQKLKQCQKCDEGYQIRQIRNQVLEVNIGIVDNCQIYTKQSHYCSKCKKGYYLFYMELRAECIEGNKSDCQNKGGVFQLQYHITDQLKYFYTLYNYCKIPDEQPNCSLFTRNVFRSRNDKCYECNKGYIQSVDKNNQFGLTSIFNPLGGDWSDKYNNNPLFKGRWDDFKPIFNCELLSEEINEEIKLTNLNCQYFEKVEISEGNFEQVCIACKNGIYPTKDTPESNIKCLTENKCTHNKEYNKDGTLVMFKTCDQQPDDPLFVIPIERVDNVSKQEFTYYKDQDNDGCLIAKNHQQNKCEICNDFKLSDSNSECKQDAPDLLGLNQTYNEENKDWAYVTENFSRIQRKQFKEDEYPERKRENCFLYMIDLLGDEEEDELVCQVCKVGYYRDGNKCVRAGQEGELCQNYGDKRILHQTNLFKPDSFYTYMQTRNPIVQCPEFTDDLFYLNYIQSKCFPNDDALITQNNNSDNVNDNDNDIDICSDNEEPLNCELFEYYTVTDPNNSTCLKQKCKQCKQDYYINDHIEPKGNCVNFLDIISTNQRYTTITNESSNTQCNVGYQFVWDQHNKDQDKEFQCIPSINNFTTRIVIQRNQPQTIEISNGDQQFCINDSFLYNKSIQYITNIQQYETCEYPQAYEDISDIEIQLSQQLGQQDYTVELQKECQEVEDKIPNCLLNTFVIQNDNTLQQQCIKCEQGYYFDNIDTNTCIQYSQDVSTNCISLCPNHNKCLKKYNNDILFGNSNICIQQVKKQSDVSCQQCIDQEKEKDVNKIYETCNDIEYKEECIDCYYCSTCYECQKFKDCEIGYIQDSAGKCVLDDEVELCDFKLPDQNCFLCSEDYYLDLAMQSRCIQRQQNDIMQCKVYSSRSDSCIVCNDGYLLESIGFENDEEVYECIEQKSELEIENCERILSNNQCFKCKPKYFLNDNKKCEEVMTLKDNCIDYKSELICISCDINYTLHNNTCKLPIQGNCIQKEIIEVEIVNSSSDSDESKGKYGWCLRKGIRKWVKWRRRIYNNKKTNRYRHYNSQRNRRFGWFKPRRGNQQQSSDSIEVQEVEVCKVCADGYVTNNNFVESNLPEFDQLCIQEREFYCQENIGAEFEELCYDVQDCMVRGWSQKCNQCAEGFVLSEDGSQCYENSSDNCEVQVEDDLECLVCSAGYHYVEGICMFDQEREGCYDFDEDNTICKTCSTGFYMNLQNKCVQNKKK